MYTSMQWTLLSYCVEISTQMVLFGFQQVQPWQQRGQLISGEQHLLWISRAPKRRTCARICAGGGSILEPVITVPSGLVYRLTSHRSTIHRANETSQCTRYQSLDAHRHALWNYKLDGLGNYKLAEKGLYISIRSRCANEHAATVSGRSWTRFWWLVNVCRNFAVNSSWWHGENRHKNWPTTGAHPEIDRIYCPPDISEAKFEMSPFRSPLNYIDMVIWYLFYWLV